MRSSIAITAAIATFATSAFAATDCNPSYDVAPSTACYTACNVKAGQKFVPGWTMDSKSELFIDSLAVMCNKTSANYGSFMATAGMCMAGCAGDDPESFNAEFAGACAWWNTHKNDKCTVATTTKATTTTTTTTKAVTTTAAPTTTKVTTTAAATTSAAVTSAVTTTATATTTTTVTATATATATATVTGTTTVTATVTATDCAAPTGTSCANYNTIFGKKNGYGVLGECCDTQADCTGSCIKGACDSEHNPSKTCTVKKYFGKKNGKGPAGACCRTQRDCVNDCRGGECTKY